jgi:hypothetical protein
VLVIEFEYLGRTSSSLMPKGVALSLHVTGEGIIQWSAWPARSVTRSTLLASPFEWKVAEWILGLGQANDTTDEGEDKV